MRQRISHCISQIVCMYIHIHVYTCMLGLGMRLFNALRANVHMYMCTCTWDSVMLICLWISLKSRRLRHCMLCENVDITPWNQHTLHTCMSTIVHVHACARHNTTLDKCLQFTEWGYYCVSASLVCSTNWATEAAQLAEFEITYTNQGKAKQVSISTL